ncbi:sigma-70 family RNA polymerase sigma factor [Actinoallomurus bryophytorum]|uniref:RNA polymerase sigma-70 factor (ECF subfamily) n=1 Tax=Actinoallomurus bryophytorum TaxID=1490222 RepID=A0A543CP59_9ACTN|nr:sigma-70 family RNA polymerase sigma factor [Actinoallomurus bryophytorum]TQL98885.1 RNA polymerase sigma-70 factor (ECF subfamily) [Actinoallomurus bryophytorum]
MSETVSGTSHRFEELEQHRVELTGYCYRMLGSAFEAEDAVQETLVRAWRGLHRFEGRAALRSWLYHIATNVCFDLLKGRQRRARPIDLGPAWAPDSPLGPPLAETTWVGPVPDSSVLAAAGGDPAEQAVSRETVRLAFVAALQHLPPRQRAVLILREVLRWTAKEVAELLGTTSASVNSALQRARSTLGERGVSDSDPVRPMDDTQRELVTRYVDAFERYDLDSLVSLLHEEATQSMPPYDLWMRGPERMRAWWSGPGIECEGSRLVPIAANSSPAFGQYRPSGPGGRFEPFSVHVLELTGDRITGLHYFIETGGLFSLFGLPPHL